MLFNEEQERTLHAVLDRLIPADDFPGGWDAGVGVYISRQLTGELHDLLPMYQAGLTAIDAEAISVEGARFADLPSAQQDALLGRIESAETAAAWPVSARIFFSHLVRHAAEGYYADSGQGGNRDQASWAMIGFLGK